MIPLKSPKSLLRMSGMVGNIYPVGYSRKRAHTCKNASIDLEFIDWFINHWRIVLCNRSQRFVSIDVALANKLSSLWINLTKISHLMWKTCIKDLEMIPRLAHLYVSQWIPVYILCCVCIDEIDVFAAGSCRAERCHAQEDCEKRRESKWLQTYT
jgi:hypothetical protein